MDPEADPDLVGPITKVNMDFCPVCEKPYTSQCRCPYSDRTCENGHEWFNDGGIVRLGKSDHSKPWKPHPSLQGKR